MKLSSLLKNIATQSSLSWQRKLASKGSVQIRNSLDASFRCHDNEENKLDPEITGLCLDSREVMPGDLFIAYPGIKTDGRQYIEQAIEKGALAIIYEETSDFSFQKITNVPVISTQNLQDQLSDIAHIFYQSPSKKMRMMAVTGTNGKTTCTHLIAKTLKSLGVPCGVIGTLGYGFPDELLKPQTNTTPDPITLQKQLITLNKKTDTVAMEVSSHALIQKRTQDIEFEVAIFTNLSHDHLDYHESMENYFQAKQILFKEYALKQAVINMDDPYGLRLLQDLKGKMPLVGYTLQKHETHDYDKDFVCLRAEQIRLSSKGIQAKIISPWGEGLLKSPLLGRFNLYNLMASLAAICLLKLNRNSSYQLSSPSLAMDLRPSLTRMTVCGGQDDNAKHQDDSVKSQGDKEGERQGSQRKQWNNGEFETILAHLSKAENIPGRMQTLGGKKQPLIVIDYAHTPDALKQSLIALREHTQGRLWCVFGCGGDRDSKKRSLMGQIAECYSDQLIITDDNPRNENPKEIVKQILSGLSCPWAAEVEHDRKTAISHAVECAKAGDIILIAGKGHEHYQDILDKKIKFNDFEQAALALAAKAASQQ